jgi:hypothetical protein
VTEPVPKIGPFIAWPIGVTEIVVPPRVGVTVSIDVMPRGFNAVFESAMPR